MTFPDIYTHSPLDPIDAPTHPSRPIVADAISCHLWFYSLFCVLNVTERNNAFWCRLRIAGARPIPEQALMDWLKDFKKQLAKAADKGVEELHLLDDEEVTDVGERMQSAMKGSAFASSTATQ